VAAKAAQSSAATAQRSIDTLPIVERAYLFLDQACFGSSARTYTAVPRIAVDEQGGNRAIEYDRRLDIEFWFRNFGRTPATITNIVSGIGYYQSYPLEIEEPVGVPLGFIVAADGISDKWPCDGQLNREEWENARQGIGHILFFGRVMYLDIFNSRRETMFCFEFDWISGDFVLSPNYALNRHT
jgi:hypothetical protein